MPLPPYPKLLYLIHYLAPIFLDWLVRCKLKRLNLRASFLIAF
uniref:Uncharacterized protein n=1 Tax=Arundo donax TaxID=35708 RepID=A0A0A9CGI2_ARUDO